ncbi:hypothetical protein DPMN_106637 [Dreissena polymorpha]|uniref:Uncharacterized protein n=1 Tax=Dreissena polymorpha TaxID=45954 RepID=A0A9D4K5A9_DREPO|nr:hypothetical protein DPMN_106637 [Dreissena polymorpha]
MNMVVVVLVLLGLSVGSTWAGECCSTHYDTGVNEHSAKWCPAFCCGSSLTGLLTCCENGLLRAASYDRYPVCADFFVQNYWVAIVIGLGGLAVLTCIGIILACTIGRSRQPVAPSETRTPVTNSAYAYGAPTYNKPTGTAHGAGINGNPTSVVW